MTKAGDLGRNARSARPAARRAEAVRLGARVRRARLELGLSLAQVAGEDFSRAFLNQVELGRSFPSTHTLQIIARKLNRGVDWFLGDPATSVTAQELQLTDAEACLRRGDAERAEPLLSGLLARSNVPGEMRARCELLLAETYLRTGRLEAALPLLQLVIKAATASRWKLLAVEAYDRLGTAYYLLRRPHEAGRWFDKALDTYEQGDRLDPLLRARVLGHRANLHYVFGAHKEAIAGYQEAIAAAEHLLDMQALGGIYEGLAASLQKTGDLDRALVYAQRSLRLYDTLQDVRMGAQLRNNMAEILLQQGQAEAAERLFLEGAEELLVVRDRALRPHLIAGAAEAALELGNMTQARVRIDEALTLAKDSTDRLAAITAERVAGRIAQAEGDSTASRQHFERAIAQASTVDSPTVHGKVAYDFARALEAQGDAASANLRYREAYVAQRAAAGV